MKEYLFLFVFISIFGLNSNGQTNREEDFQELVILLFEKQVIQPLELLENLEVDSCIYIGYTCEILDPDKVFILQTNEKQLIKIGSSKNIFFYDIKKWIKIYSCNITDLEATMYIEVIVDNKIIRRGCVEYQNTNSKWVIHKEKIKTIDEDFSWLKQNSR
jgi:hypothetical protein